MFLKFKLSSYANAIISTLVTSFAGWWGPHIPWRHSLLTWLYIKAFDVFIRQNIPPINKEKLLRAGKVMHHQNSNDALESLPRQQNPKEVGRCRRPMHSKFRSFQKKSHAIGYGCRKGIHDEDCNAHIMLLTGKAGVPDENYPWDFELIGDPFDLPDHLIGWHELQFDSSSWSKVSLPNHWQLQGFDIPLYTNTSYPFRFDPPFTIRDGIYHLTTCDEGIRSDRVLRRHPKEPGINATGLFRRNFVIPTGWKECTIFQNRIFLIFEGVDSCLTVWINGNFVGYSQDSCLSAEFDVTEYLDLTDLRDNNISVEVSRWCDGSYLEDQDKWWLSGIYREVYLIMKPISHISDIEFTSSTTFNDIQPLITTIELSILAEGVQSRMDQADAFFSRGQPHAIRVELWENFESTEPLAIGIGECIGRSKFFNRMKADNILDCDTADIQMCELNSPGVADISMIVQNPRMWSAEDPQLYTLIVTLYPSVDKAQDGTEEGISSAILRVGIREIEIGGPDNCLLINKKRITIAGVNRLEFEPLTGRAVSKDSMLKDAKLLKKLNFNAVRTAHYPQHPYWLEVCDEIGLYVIDEANIESHGFQALSYPIGFLSNHVQWRGAMACRVSRMFERDKNHASIIGWSLGNESGHGPTHDLMADWLRMRDARRFVQYESGGSCTYATDVICPMYQRPKWCVEKACNDSLRRPVILCEYAHAMGNSGGCLSQYWDLFDNDDYPRLQGGFIWDFVDQGLSLHKDESRKFIYGGDFGESPHSKNFCCNGITSPHRIPYPDAIEASYLQSPIQIKLSIDSSDLILVVSNKRSFLSLNDIDVTVSLEKCAGVFTEKKCLGVFKLDIGDIFAGSSKSIKVNQCIANILFNNTDLCDSDTMWLGVTACKRGSTSLWNADDVSLYETSFELDSWTNYFAQNTLPSEAISQYNNLLWKQFGDCGSISVSEKAHELELRWSISGVIMTFNKAGEMLRWLLPGGMQLLTSPPEICLYRATTDNDNGGDSMSFSNRWKAAGYQSLHPVNSSPLSFAVLPTGNVQLSSCFNLVSANNSGIVIPCTLIYTCHANSGAIDIVSAVHLPPNAPPLPRVGLRFSLPSSFENVRWMGLGPHEAYDDRKSSAFLGVFRSKVDDLHTPYVVPQENGRRADPRWIDFMSSDAKMGVLGILVNDSERRDGRRSQCEGYGFSVGRFSTEELDTKLHDFDLLSSDDNRVFVHVDSRMMGVGGFDSWSPNVESRFLIDGNRTYTTRMTLIHRSCL